MPTKKKHAKPALTLIAVFMIIILAVTLGFNWLNADQAASQPVTSHTFEAGKLNWSIDAYPAKVLQDNMFSITAQDANGTPLEGAIMTVKLEMLGMICGDVEFSLREVSPGSYEGTGFPLMAGNWKATLTLEDDGQIVELERLLKAVH